MVIEQNLPALSTSGVNSARLLAQPTAFNGLTQGRDNVPADFDTANNLENQGFLLPAKLDLDLPQAAPVFSSLRSVAFFFAIVSAVPALFAELPAVDPLPLVNPLVGTAVYGGGLGPAAPLPAGVIYLSPQTSKPSWAGYAPEQPIFGFAHTQSGGLIRVSPPNRAAEAHSVALGEVRGNRLARLLFRHAHG